MAVNASYGATFAQTASVAAYQLHAAPLPAGCTYSSTFYKYCWLVSGQATGALTSGTISLMYTNSLTTFPFNFSASSVINNTTLTSLNNQYAFQTDPGLASCVLVAGYYECVSSVGDNAGKNTVLYTISASADMASINFVAFDYAIRPTYSANWDTGYNRIDSHLYFNKHGFYEYFYTAFNGSAQYIGYAVAPQITVLNGLLGPGLWYRQNACAVASNNPGCVIPKSSAFYQGLTFVGESSIFEQNGLLLFESNADDGGNNSQASLGIMPDY